MSNKFKAGDRVRPAENTAYGRAYFEMGDLATVIKTEGETLFRINWDNGYCKKHGYGKGGMLAWSNAFEPAEPERDEIAEMFS